MAEVVEQSEFEACCFQVVVYLGAVAVVEIGDCLDLHDDVAIAHEIGAVGGLQFLSVIVYLQFFLAFERDASLGELQC